ncbi:amino acid ABC transporter permease [Companilactobacillus allii]|uniref:Cysteine ABC transporter permease n=1 Tax=Companilactobacillus allii TaxID=1847728 RepID=A0A1P8Q2X8_9LACO|nr:amino acid ABC transporter permease [Companilactobacillus allii]APX72234.1 cysteine ABC transporter permease [Companilactobacillus allii]USQ69327.1 amino acid ABC transporter permease [Companilactobacillus allii]
MWHIIISSLPEMIGAMLQFTIPLAIISFIFGLILAVLTALIKFIQPSENKALKYPWLVLRAIANFYVWLFRSTPLLVQLFIIFFGLPSVGIQLPAFIAAVIGFSLNTGAYASETIRSALLSVPQDQWDAAYTLNFTTRQTLMKIVLPQAVRIALPPLSNSFIGLVKDTSLASSITILEMFQVSQQITAKNYQPLLMYTLAAALYAIVCSLLSWLQHYLERRTSKYVKGGQN